MSEEQIRADERERIAQAIEALPTTPANPADMQEALLISLAYQTAAKVARRRTTGLTRAEALENRVAYLRASIEALARDIDRYPHIPTTAATLRFVLEQDEARA